MIGNPLPFPSLSVSQIFEKKCRRALRDHLDCRVSNNHVTCVPVKFQMLATTDSAHRDAHARFRRLKEYLDAFLAERLWAKSSVDVKVQATLGDTGSEFASRFNMLFPCLSAAGSESKTLVLLGEVGSGDVSLAYEREWMNFRDDGDCYQVCSLFVSTGCLRIHFLSFM